MIRIGQVAGLAAAALLLAAAYGCDARRPATAPLAEVTGAAGASPATAAVDDAAIAAQLRAALHGDPTTREAEIQLHVDGGRVRLSGFVDSAAVRLRAGMLAAGIDGVTGVDNRLIQRHHAGSAADLLGDLRVHL